jgi:AraC-like DNA-binding protein
MEEKLNARMSRLRWELAGSQDADAADIYRDSVSNLFDVELNIENPSDFYNGVDSYNLGGMLFSRCHSVGQTFKRSRAMARRSGIDHIQIILESKGVSRADYDGRSVDAAPGTLRMTDLARPYVSQNESFDFLNLVLPRSALGASWANKDIHGVTFAADRPAVRLLTAHMQTLWTMMGDLSVDEAKAGVAALSALIGGAISGQSELQPEHRQPVERTLLSLARAHIDRNIGKPDLTPDTICVNIGVSRRSLYRLFEGSGGVAAFIWGRRLDLAFDAISRSRGKGRLADIAYAHGFQSESHFSRAFRARFGTLPSELRELVHLTPSADLSAMTANRDAIDNWVGNLQGS